jgi:hypothetical protein
MRSSIVNLRSLIFDLRSSILHPRSSILHPQSSILDPQFSILDPRSSILHPRSAILHPRSSIVVLALLVFTGCRQDMHDQPKYRPLRPVEQIGTINDGRSARPRVEGTVARGELRDDVEFYTGRVARSGLTPENATPSSPRQLAGQPVSGGASGMQQFVAEFPMQISARDLDIGQERFNIYCSVCHGPLGDGGGIVPRRGFRRPPTYHDDRLRNAPVGYFFDVITNGFGNMPDYSAQVDPADRWRIIAYIRALQLSQRASVADVPPDKRGELNKKPDAKEGQAHEGAK